MDEGLECPICHGDFADPISTPCGHSFCASCIDESISRKQECPCCKAHIERGQLVPNRLAESLLQKLATAVESEESARFAAASGAAVAHPVDTVVWERIRPLLRSFRTHHDACLEKAGNVAGDGSDVDAQKAQVSEAVCDALRTYLARLPSSPTIVPQPVRVRCGRLEFPHTLGPATTGRTLLDVCKERVAAQGDAVLSVAPDASVHVDGSPECRASLHAPVPLASALHEKMWVSCTLRVEGVLLRSEQPQTCFSLAFRKGTGQRVTYMRCDTCNTNWICPACHETCHKDHQTRVHIPDHEPTFACCYCPRKCTCLLPNLKTRPDLAPAASPPAAMA